MREALLQLLEGKKPESIVWTADITYWMEGRRRDGVYRPEWDTEEGFLALHQQLGILPYYFYGWAGPGTSLPLSRVTVASKRSAMSRGTEPSSLSALHAGNSPSSTRI